ncbi:UROD/MetE-like protein [Trametes versicolor FP-101664 SS1]|uniref:UROD/MetE-like protein n=1 Tax=Trametes versicolor (strain FP-101664) TaxID=717944 RepID=UPI000462422C|nr:UROD/MetE-like protein [Trametes versicolor FP-101664 SS1]EIW62345.1 UROD/MetE-like protein [Trametes versicolor FP-101664 SS1]
MSAPTLKLNPPFRAEQIGSLKRPQALLEKRKEFEAGKCTQEELRVVEDEAIKAVVQVQRETGIKGITDGEFRRHMFYDGVFDNLDGMKHIKPVPMHMLMDYVPDVAAFKEHDFKGADTYVCVSKLKRTKQFYVPQYEALKALTSPEEHKNLKITMAAPEWFHLRHGEYAYPKDVYKNDDEYFADIAVAYQAELQDLYAAGCRNIQIDDPLLAYFCAESMIKGMEERGINHEALLDTYIKAYNDCLKNRPADMNVGLHLCRGNFRSGMHFSEGGYDRIAIKLFQEINVDCYYLEYDTPRAGTFEPLRFLPPHKAVVLGLISTKFPRLEEVDDLVQRVRNAATIISGGDEKRSFEAALNQICISPQCGFASHSEGNLVDDHAMREKLALVTRTARAIWGEN